MITRITKNAQIQWSFHPIILLLSLYESLIWQRFTFNSKNHYLIRNSWKYIYLMFVFIFDSLLETMLMPGDAILMVDVAILPESCPSAGWSEISFKCKSLLVCFVSLEDDIRSPARWWLVEMSSASPDSGIRLYLDYDNLYYILQLYL